MCSLYLIPLWGLLIGIGSSLLNLFVIRVFAKKKFETIEIESEVEELLDQRFDGVLEELKARIPMGQTFITGGLQETLKLYGKKEILKMVPEFKERLRGRIHKGGVAPVLVSIGVGGALGFILGVIWMLLCG